MTNLNYKNTATALTSWIIEAVIISTFLFTAFCDAKTKSNPIATTNINVKTLNDPLVLAQKFSIQSHILNETRQFYLHLPAGYPQNGKAYPVMYIPDGHNKMQKTVAVIDDLARFGNRIPNMIVVGIETNRNRKADLSTFTTSIAFLNFINKELKPFINANYQTNGENLLMGSSMGGEFVLRALLEQPESFDGYFATSPSVYYSDFKLVDSAITISENKMEINKKLYISVANEGWNQGVEEFVYHLKKSPIQGLDWQFNKQEHESHGSISLRQSYADLQDYYKSWAAPHFANTADFEQKGGVDSLIKLYSNRKNTSLPIGLLEHLALLYIDEQQTKKAIELALLAVKEHPTSGRALRNLAIVYEKLSMLDNALKSYEKALKVSIDNNHRAASIESHRNVLAEFKARH